MSPRCRRHADQRAERQLVDSATARHVEASMSVIGRAMAASSPSPPRVLVLSEMEGVHEPNGTSCAESVVESAVETPARVAADDTCMRSVEIERPKSFIEKLKQLRYAPRDLFIVFSIKFFESTAYFGFSYVYAPFLSEEVRAVALARRVLSTFTFLSPPPPRPLPTHSLRRSVWVYGRGGGLHLRGLRPAVLGIRSARRSCG